MVADAPTATDVPGGYSFRVAAGPSVTHDTTPEEVGAAPDPVELTTPWPPGRLRDGTRFFSVLSWGCAGTTWLAKALNSHPEIFCVHCFNVELRRRSNPNVRTQGVDYAGLIERAGSDYRFLGEVNGFTADDIPLLRNALGPSFSIAALVREPIARLRSHLAFRGLPEKVQRARLDHVDDLVKRRGLPFTDLDPELRFFIHSANMLNTILREQQQGPVYRMEDVTARPDVFADLFVHLTGGELEAEPWWIEMAAHLPPIRVAGGPKPELTEQQQEIVSIVVRPAAWAAYEELGYERPGFLPA